MNKNFGQFFYNHKDISKIAWKFNICFFCDKNNNYHKKFKITAVILEDHASNVYLLSYVYSILIKAH